MSEHYVMMYLKRPKGEDGASHTDAVMYPFESDTEMLAFKQSVDRLHNGTYCDDCERVDPEDIDPSDYRDESRD
jgi:hypothetical protein